MSITVGYDEFSNALKTCKTIVSKERGREILTCIHLFTDNNGNAIMEALDGFQLIQLLIPMASRPEESIDLIFEPIALKKCGKESRVEITAQEHTIQFSYGNFTDTVKCIDQKYINTVSIFPEGNACFQVCFNPKLLKTIAAAFSDEDSVSIAFYSGRAPAIFSSSTKKGLLLPLGRSEAQ